MLLKKRRGIIGFAFLLIFSAIMLLCMDVDGRERNLSMQSVDSKDIDLTACEFYDTCSEHDFLHMDIPGDSYGISTYVLGETIEETGLFQSNLDGLASEIYEWIAESGLTYENNGCQVSFYLEEDQTPSEVFEQYRAVYPLAMWSYEYDHLEQFYWCDLNGIEIGADFNYDDFGLYGTFTFSYRKSAYYTEESGQAANTKLYEGIAAAKEADTVYDQLICLNNWTCDNCQYDYEGLSAADYTEASYFAHSMMGLLVNGKGVCEAYAKTFKLLCQNLGIPCVVVVSEDHAFNYVKVDGQWYMIDCTFNDSGDDPDHYQDLFLIPNHPAIDFHHEELELYTYPVTASDAYRKKPQDLMITDSMGDEITSLKLDSGKSAVINVYGANSRIHFYSVDEEIASVSDNGVIKGIHPGKVKIQIIAEEDTYYEAASALITVSVRPAATKKVSLSNTSGGIKISWEKVADATGYYVYRGSSRIADIKSGKTISYEDKASLTNGTKYTYKVFAYADSGVSNSNKSAFTYRLSRPKITGLTNSASKKMKVTYNKNSKATGYKIQYSTSSSFSPSKTVTISTNTTTSRVIGSLTKGKKYYVRARSYKKVSGVVYQSAWSDKKSVIINK